MNTAKDFTNETEARIFRDAKRQEGLAASVFTYGKDRYRVTVWEKWEMHPERTQRALSDKAYQVSNDIEDLTKVKEIISAPDYPDYDYDNLITVARKLERERWFNTPKDVIDFLESPDTGLDKIKGMVDTALQEYDEEWNDKSGVTA